MQMSQRQGYLSNKEPSLLLLEPLDFDQVTEKFAALDEFHDEIDPEIVLKHELHVHDERMIDLKENVFLKLDVLKLLILHDDVLPDALHRIYLLIELVLHHIHLPEGALTDHAQNGEILKTRLPID